MCVFFIHLFTDWNSPHFYIIHAMDILDRNRKKNGLSCILLANWQWILCSATPLAFKSQRHKCDIHPDSVTAGHPQCSDHVNMVHVLLVVGLCRVRGLVCLHLVCECGFGTAAGLDSPCFMSRDGHICLHAEFLRSGTHSTSMGFLPNECPAASVRAAACMRRWGNRCQSLKNTF